MKYVTKVSGELSKYFKEYQDLLGDFCIPFSPTIQHRVIELYPNEIAMENYIRSLILGKLDEEDNK